MSPRAAWRLEMLGFDQVYDYAAGKADWGAAGLSREGKATSEPSAGDVADRTAATYSLTDDLQEVRKRVRAAGWDQCIVVNEQRIVLGRIGRKALATDDELTVEQAMQEGPSTVRPNVPLAELEQRLERQGFAARSSPRTKDGWSGSSGEPRAMPAPDLIGRSSSADPQPPVSASRWCSTQSS